MEMYKVIGVGRVGSKEKAKQGHYFRKRKYWAIAKWSKVCSTYCKEEQERLGHHKIHYPVGWVEDTTKPHFKTKGEAENYLEELLRG